MYLWVLVYRRETAALKDQLFGAVDEDNVEQLKKDLPTDSEVKDKVGSLPLYWVDSSCTVITPVWINTAALCSW